MNRATGNQKVAAMAAVINELVAQRSAMRKHMHQMMQSHGMMERERRPAAAPPTSPPDSTASDSTSHAEHHPPQ